MWRRDETIPGLTFAETDEIAMALELAVREVPAWNEILQTQLDRTQNPDRKARFAFVMPALSADPRVARTGVRRGCGRSRTAAASRGCSNRSRT